MPNKKVRFFKSYEQIKEKIIYVNDKNLIGFDTASSQAFQFRLFKLKNFEIAENFILIDDDCFFGKPIKKSDFFYYDEKSKMVLPNLVTDDAFDEMTKKFILEKYNYFLKIKNKDLTKLLGLHSEEL